jgi:hypothetical protein
MSFRQKRNEWDEFLKRHGDEIRNCGVPADVVKNETRFYIFLEHGYDEFGWFKNKHAFFSSSILTGEQIVDLAQIVGDHIDEKYRKIIESRWSGSSKPQRLA